MCSHLYNNIFKKKYINKDCTPETPTDKQISTLWTCNKLEFKVPFAIWNKTKICLLKNMAQMLWGPLLASSCGNFKCGMNVISAL